VAAQTHDVVMKQMESAQGAPITVASASNGRMGKGARDPFLPPMRGSAPMSQPALAAALLLGSPDFQRR
jgi:hypothetical protein